MTRVIINADDFGMSSIFNEVILDFLRKGFVYSTTVMVNRIDATQTSQVNELKKLSATSLVSVGLHLEFDSLDYSTQIESQLGKFEEYFGKIPSHIDVYKGSDFEDSFELIAKKCRELSIPLRHCGKKFDGVKMTDEKVFNGSVESFRDIFKWASKLDPYNTYEILFHPGAFDPNCKSSLNKERELDAKHIMELNKLSDVKRFEIISYLEL